MSHVAATEQRKLIRGKLKLIGKYNPLCQWNKNRRI